MNYEERLELFENNKGLAYSFVHDHKYDIDGMDQDDQIQIALIALWKAAQSYDNETGNAFSTLATRCMQNDFGKLFYAADRQKRIPKDAIVHYDDMPCRFEDSTDGHEAYMAMIQEDSVEGQEQANKDCLISLTVQGILDKFYLQEKQEKGEFEAKRTLKMLIDYFYEGYSYAEIGQSIDCGKYASKGAQVRIKLALERLRKGLSYQEQQFLKSLL